jgi:hypothetical protein
MIKKTLHQVFGLWNVIEMQVTEGKLLAADDSVLVFDDSEPVFPTV